MTTHWNEYLELLHSTFGPYYLSQKSHQHLDKAYHEVEQRWSDFNQNIVPRRVLIGEATLFHNDSYIYNPATPNSSFLRPSDFPNEPTGNKEKLLKLLKQHRLLIIDAYPFAFNKYATPNLTYGGKLKSIKFQSFLIKAFNLYCVPKIIKILKQNSDVRISFRYKRNDNLLGIELDRVLKLHSNFHIRFPSVSGRIPIDKQKFHHFLSD